MARESESGQVRVEKGGESGAREREGVRESGARERDERERLKKK